MAREKLQMKYKMLLSCGIEKDEFKDFEDQYKTTPDKYSKTINISIDLLYHI